MAERHTRGREGYKLFKIGNATGDTADHHNFPIFELIKDAPHGTYGLKFTISNSKIDDAHYDTLPKDDLIKEIEKQFSRKENLEDR